MTSTPATMPLLHRFLGIGLVTVTGLAVVLRKAPGLPPPRDIFSPAKMVCAIVAAVSMFAFWRTGPHRE